MNTDYLGIIVDNIVYQGIPYGKTGYEEIALYEEAAEQCGIRLCYFRLKDCYLGQEKITAYVKDADDTKYKKQVISTPKVIHNRGLYFTKEVKAAVNALVEDGKILFNPWNRFSKLEVHNLLNQYQELQSYLPETYKATKEMIKDMLEKHNALIIKPISGSLGSGIMKVESSGKEHTITYYSRQEKGWKSITFTDEIPSIIQKNIVATTYVVQEYIPLASYHGSVYDLRVSCQKNRKGAWQVTGVAGKVAAGNNFITNVARGGKNYEMNTLLDASFNEQEIMRGIETFSIQAANVLEIEYPGLADLGFDMGITTTGLPMFIECNGRDLRISFRNAGMNDTWKATFAMPINYGKYLLEKEM